jgi:hypothetical protein
VPYNEVVKLDRFEMRVDEDFLSSIDGWRRLQDDLPTRAESVRRLVGRALTAEAASFSAEISALLSAHPSLKRDFEISTSDGLRLSQRRSRSRAKHERSAATHIRILAEQLEDRLEGVSGEHAERLRAILARLTS